LNLIAIAILRVGKLCQKQDCFVERMKKNKKKKTLGTSKGIIGSHPYLNNILKSEYSYWIPHRE